MNTYYVKLLLFTFLINILILPYYENFQKNHYNVSLILKNTQRTIIKSRLLAQTKNHNPHYHNDPELKEIIDKMNEEAIKKYQQTHEPYEQLKELVEKNGTKVKGGHGTQPMSTTEKELLETYEEVFGHKNDIMLKSSMYPNEDDKSDKSSSCEFIDTNNTDFTKTKGKDKYLKNLKHRCIGGICSCSVVSAILTYIGLLAAKAAAYNYVAGQGGFFGTCASFISIYNMLDGPSMIAAVEAGTKVCTFGLTDLMPTAASYASAIFVPCGIAALVLLILAVVLIILYIWLYRRRKNSWKHECKKHLFYKCKKIYSLENNFSLEKISHNNANRFDIINATFRRLLAESHETHIFKTHSGENSLAYPIDNKSDKNDTEYYEASSNCTFRDEFLQNFFHQKEQIEWKNKNDSKSIFQKLHQKLHQISHFRKLPIIATTSVFYNIPYVHLI
ncbi:stevor PIR protein, putative [Plasmodium reichenowi]|uniref:Stevor PIR protein, putative n=1 Tax=Plasmodium reichenowi TaxID=5854 RepID=A0A2P9DTR9_PLARE|nr:stevor PIR protein, putative [Plasmodium reichenowi]